MSGSTPSIYILDSDARRYLELGRIMKTMSGNAAKFQPLMNERREIQSHWTTAQFGEALKNVK